MPGPAISSEPLYETGTFVSHLKASSDDDKNLRRLVRVTPQTAALLPDQ